MLDGRPQRIRAGKGTCCLSARITPTAGDSAFGSSREGECCFDLVHSRACRRPPAGRRPSRNRRKDRAATPGLWGLDSFRRMRPTGVSYFAQTPLGPCAYNTFSIPPANGRNAHENQLGSRKTLSGPERIYRSHERRKRAEKKYTVIVSS